MSQVPGRKIFMYTWQNKLLNLFLFKIIQLIQSINDLLQKVYLDTTKIIPFKQVFHKSVLQLGLFCLGQEMQQEGTSVAVLSLSTHPVCMNIWFYANTKNRYWSLELSKCVHNVYILPTEMEADGWACSLSSLILVNNKIKFSSHIHILISNSNLASSVKAN